MSSPPRQRAPLYYCYECNAEMRPLMVPDPHCASCNGTFVEEIPTSRNDGDSPGPSSSADDPRNFQQDLGGLGGPDLHFHNFPAGGGAGGDPIIQLMNMLMAGMPPTPPARGPGGSGTTFRFDIGGGRGNIIFASGGGTGSPLSGIVPGPSSGSPGTGSGSGSPRGGARPIPMHPLEGLFAALSGGGGGGMFGPPMQGRMGDYVLDQGSLDEIITRLMEQSQGAQPVPAPDDMIAKLPRTVVTADSPLTEKECAVCKDTFEPSPDPVVTIQCNPNPKYQHTFHDDCIVPWLKQNGTCPVCRFQLVPQPDHHHGPPPPPGSGSGPENNRRNSGSSGGGGGGGGGGASRGGSGFSGFWDMLSSAVSGSGGSGNAGSSNNNSASTSSSDGNAATGATGSSSGGSNPQQQQRSTPPRPNERPPGAWEQDPLD